MANSSAKIVAVNVGRVDWESEQKRGAEKSRDAQYMHHGISSHITDHFLVGEPVEDVEDE